MGTDSLKTDFRFYGIHSSNSYNTQFTVSVASNERLNTSASVIFEVSIAMIINIAVLNYVTPCSLVKISQRFRGTLLLISVSQSKVYQWNFLSSFPTEVFIHF
jgi:hypothetical protein